MITLLLRWRVPLALTVCWALLLAGCPELCNCNDPPKTCEPDTSVVPPYLDHVCEGLNPEECGDTAQVLSAQKLGIRFDPNLSEADQAAIVAGVPILRPFAERELEFTTGFLADGIQQTIIPTQACTLLAEVVGAIAQLNATAGVLFASPVFEQDGRVVSIVLDGIAARFSLDTPVEEIDKLNERYGLEVSFSFDMPSTSERHYLLRNTSTWPLDTLALAHVYHQESIVLHASPDFLILLDFIEAE